MLTRDEAARMTLPGWQVAARRRRAAPIPLMLLAAAGLYALVAPWHSFDADHWFVPWLGQMLATGPLQALGAPMQVATDGASGYANYNPPYLYLLALGSLLSPALDALQIVKAVSIAGTLACAGCVFVVIRQVAPPGPAALGAAVFLVLPTVVLNGPGWGQTDAIYTGLMALAVAAAIAGHAPFMLLAFGAALAFKLPAAFLGPFVLYVVIARRVPLWQVSIVPLTYAASLVPAWLAGRSAHDLAGVYVSQAGTYQWLSMKAPNPWAAIQYLGLLPYGQGVLLGTAAAALAGLAIAALAFRWRLDKADLLLLAVASVTLMPFLLPKMHDRYFFPADVLSFAYAAVAPGRRPAMIAACVQFGSLAAYASIMAGVRAGPLLGSVCMAAALALIGLQLRAALRQQRSAITRRPATA